MNTPKNQLSPAQGVAEKWKVFYTSSQVETHYWVMKESVSVDGNLLMGKIILSLSDRAESFLRSQYHKKGDLSKYVSKLLLDAEAEEAGVKPWPRSVSVLTAGVI